MLGLLWLKFLNTNIEDFVEQDLSLEELMERVEELKEVLEEEQKEEIMAKFIDLEYFREKNIDQIMMDFNEYFLLNMKDEAEQQHFQSKNSNIFNQSYKDEAFTLKNPSDEHQSNEKVNLGPIKGNFTLQEH